MRYATPYRYTNSRVSLKYTTIVYFTEIKGVVDKS